MKNKNTTKYIRVVKDSNYSVIHNEVLKRKDLSWKAKGIMAYILTLPDDWNINLNEVMQHATEKEAAFRTGWKELENAGYVKRYPVKDEKTKKFKYWETVIYEKAQNSDEEDDAATASPETPEVPKADEKPHSENQEVDEPHGDFPHLEKPHVENPHLGKPHVENQVLLSTKELSTEELSTEGTNTTTTTSSGNENAFRFYENNGYGMIAPLVRDKISGWIDDISKTGTSEEEADAIVRKALEFGVLNNKRSWGYVNRILIDWENRGLNTLDKLAAAENQREAEKEKTQKTSYSYGGRKPVRKETLPDWAKEDHEQKTEEKEVDAETKAEFAKRLEKIRAYREG